jgi:hypothetical protein
MEKSVQLYGKTTAVRLTASAERALERRKTPLYAEVQLIFGCMIAKRVWFREEPVDNAAEVTSMLKIWFRPARYAKTCSFDEIDDGAEASDYPMVADPKGFVPDLVTIDYQGGKWKGDFTWSLEARRAAQPVSDDHGAVAEIPNHVLTSG